MAEEKIDSYLDLVALKKETDSLLGYIEALQKAKLDLSTAVTSVGFAANPREAVTAANTIISTTQKATKTVSELQRATEALAKAQSEEAKQVALLKVQKAELTKQNKAEAESSLQTEAAKKREAKIVENATDEYKQLNKALSDAEVKYKNLYLTQGAESQLTKAALKDALSIRQVLDTVDQSLGNFQRNVGNYKSGFDGLGTSLQGLLRETPSVQNINQLFLSWSNQLPQFFEEIQKVNAELKILKDQSTIANELLTKQGAAQQLASSAAEDASEALSSQVESVISGIAASKEQALALKEQITGMVASSEATAEAAVATAANTEQLVINSGASLEEAAALRLQVETTLAATAASTRATIALEEQAVATAAANAAAASQPGILARLGSSLFSLNSLLVLGVLALTLFGGKIVDWISGLIKGKDAINDLKENLKNANDVMSEANKKAGEQISTLKILRATAQDITLSDQERLKAVKELQKEFPTTYKQLSDEIILNGKDKAATDALTKSLLEAARARASKGKLDEIEAQRLDIEFKKQKIRNATDQEIDAAKKTTKEKGIFEEQYDKNVKDLRNYNVRIVEERRDAALKEEDDKDKRLKSQSDFLLKFAGGEKAISKVIEEDDKKKEKSAKDVKTIADAVKELRTELASLSQEETLGRITPNDADIDRVKAYDKAFKAIFDTGAGANNAKVIELQAELDPISQRVLEQQLKDIIAKIPKPTEILAPPDAPLKKRLEVYKSYAEDEAKLYDDIAQRQMVVFQANAANEQAVIIQHYRDKKISKTQFEQDMLDVQQKYAEKGLQFAIEYAERSVSTLQVGTKAREDAELKLANLKKQLNKEDLDYTKETEDKKREEILKTIATIEGFTNQAFDIIGSALNNSIANQKNALQEVEDQRQKDYENQVASINSLSISEEEKNKKIMLLESQRKAQKDKFERDQRQLDLQRARFEKAQAITNIIFNTAAAVVKALPNIPLAVIVGALGAIQLGLAIAAPLPKFKAGKFNNYEGMAIVGDGGKSEPIVRADGTIEMSPATPTQTWIGKNDLVFPDVEALRNRVATAQTDRVLGSSYRSNSSDGLNNDALKKALERHGKDVVSAIQNKPTVHFNVTERGMQVIAQSGNSWTEYINSNVRGTA